MSRLPISPEIVRLMRQSIRDEETRMPPGLQKILSMARESIPDGKFAQPICEWVKVTPEIAQALLDTLSGQQRTIKVASLKSMEADSRDGRFDVCYQPAMVSESGTLLDAQHRCRVIVHTGNPITMPILFGVPDWYYRNIDGGSPRTRADTAKAMGFSNTSQAGALCQMISAWENRKTDSRRRITLGEYNKASNSLTGEILDKYRDELQFISSSICKKLRVLGPPTPFGFAYFTLAFKSKPHAEEFFQSLASGANLDAGSPILAVRHRLETFRQERHSHKNWAIVGLIIKGWNRWIDGKTADRFEISKQVDLVEPLAPKRGRRA